MGYTAAVITVSDKGARGERVDTSGPRLVSLLKEHGYDVRYTAIIPDEREQIKAELVKCADELRISLVLTNGGTGFSSRDITLILQSGGASRLFCVQNCGARTCMLVWISPPSRIKSC